MKAKKTSNFDSQENLDSFIVKLDSPELDKYLDLDLVNEYIQNKKEDYVFEILKRSPKDFLSRAFNLLILNREISDEFSVKLCTLIDVSEKMLTDLLSQWRRCNHYLLEKLVQKFQGKFEFKTIDNIFELTKETGNDFILREYIVRNKRLPYYFNKNSLYSLPSETVKFIFEKRFIEFNHETMDLYIVDLSLKEIDEILPFLYEIQAYKISTNTIDSAIKQKKIDFLKKYLKTQHLKSDERLELIKKEGLSSELFELIKKARPDKISLNDEDGNIHEDDLLEILENKGINKRTKKRTEKVYTLIEFNSSWLSEKGYEFEGELFKISLEKYNELSKELKRKVLENHIKGHSSQIHQSTFESKLGREYNLIGEIIYADLEEDQSFALKYLKSIFNFKDKDSRIGGEFNWQLKKVISQSPNSDLYKKTIENLILQNIDKIGGDGISEFDIFFTANLIVKMGPIKDTPSKYDDKDGPQINYSSYMRTLVDSFEEDLVDISFLLHEFKKYFKEVESDGYLFRLSNLSHEKKLELCYQSIDLFGKNNVFEETYLVDNSRWMVYQHAEYICNWISGYEDKLNYALSLLARKDFVGSYLETISCLFNKVEDLMFDEKLLSRLAKKYKINHEIKGRNNKMSKHFDNWEIIHNLRDADDLIINIISDDIISLSLSKSQLKVISKFKTIPKISLSIIIGGFSFSTEFNVNSKNEYLIDLKISQFKGSLLMEKNGESPFFLFKDENEIKIESELNFREDDDENKDYYIINGSLIKNNETYKKINDHILAVLKKNSNPEEYTRLIKELRVDRLLGVDKFKFEELSDDQVSEYLNILTKRYGINIRQAFKILAEKRERWSYEESMGSILRYLIKHPEVVGVSDLQSLDLITNDYDFFLNEKLPTNTRLITIDSLSKKVILEKFFQENNMVKNKKISLMEIIDHLKDSGKFKNTEYYQQICEVNNLTVEQIDEKLFGIESDYIKVPPLKVNKNLLSDCKKKLKTGELGRYGSLINIIQIIRSEDLEFREVKLKDGTIRYEQNLPYEKILNKDLEIAGYGSSGVSLDHNNFKRMDNLILRDFSTERLFSVFSRTHDSDINDTIQTVNKLIVLEDDLFFETFQCDKETLFSRIRNDIKNYKKFMDIHDYVGKYEDYLEKVNYKFEDKQNILSSIEGKDYSGGFSLSIPKETKDLIEIGSRLGICVGRNDYDQKIINGESFILNLVSKKEEICVEFDLKSKVGDVRLSQARTNKNKDKSELPCIKELLSDVRDIMREQFDKVA